MSQLHQGHRDRLRERFVKDGFESFEDHQVLELLLFYSIQRKDTNETAHRLLDTFGSLAAVFEAEPSELMKVKGIGYNSAVLISSISGLFRRYSQSRNMKTAMIGTTFAAKAYAEGLLYGKKYECLYMICLDSKGNVINSRLMSEGTLDEVAAYPRKIVETALQCKAHSVILAHNHPGGTSYPSQADVDVTNKIADALKAIDIELRDHIIVAPDKIESLMEFKAVKEAQEKKERAQISDGI